MRTSDGPGDGGLPAAEVSRTFERLFAIPTQAYTNAYGDAGVDMRPAMPTFTFGPADGGIMKLGMPSFALTETASASSVGGRVQPAPTTSLAQQGSDAVMSDLLGDDGRARPAVAASMGGPGSGLQQEVGESHKWAMGSQWLSLAQKSAASGDAASPAGPVARSHSPVAKAAVTVNKHTSPAAKAAAVASKQQLVAAAVVGQSAQKLHAVTTTALSGAALTSSALASVDRNRVKALAQARLKRKQLASMKDEHLDATDAGPSEHGRKKANLDSQISGSGKWLQKAVMVLAIIAGTCICGGICAVIYCYRNRHMGDDDKTKIPTREQQLNGKNFGRATPQYGSYGAKRR